MWLALGGSSRAADVTHLGTQSTCFTGTNVQILTQKALLVIIATFRSALAATELQQSCNTFRSALACAGGGGGEDGGGGGKEDLEGAGGIRRGEGEVEGRELEPEATQEMGGRGCMLRELGVPLTIEGERVRDSILDAVVSVWGESWGRMGVAPVLPPDAEPTRPPVEVCAWAWAWA